jgi:hypothetical protein
MRQKVTVIYYGEGKMQAGIRNMQRQGWMVVNSQSYQRNYSCSKTCCLGALFLPLALLGRKDNAYQITFER